VFQTLEATILKARSPNLSLDRGKNKTKFDAGLRTVGRVLQEMSVSTVQPFLSALDIGSHIFCRCRGHVL